MHAELPDGLNPIIPLPVICNLILENVEDLAIVVFIAFRLVSLALTSPRSTTTIP